MTPATPFVSRCVTMCFKASIHSLIHSFICTSVPPKYSSLRLPLGSLSFCGRSVFLVQLSPTWRRIHCKKAIFLQAKGLGCDVSLEPRIDRVNSLFLSLRLQIYAHPACRHTCKEKKDPSSSYIHIRNPWKPVLYVSISLRVVPVCSVP